MLHLQLRKIWVILMIKSPLKRLVEGQLTERKAGRPPLVLAREELLVVRSLALVMVIGLVAFRDKGKGRGEAGPFTRVLYLI